MRIVSKVFVAKPSLVPAHLNMILIQGYQKKSEDEASFKSFCCKTGSETERLYDPIIV